MDTIGRFGTAIDNDRAQLEQEVARLEQELSQTQHCVAELESNIRFLTERLENEIDYGIKPGDKIEQ